MRRCNYKKTVEGEVVFHCTNHAIKHPQANKISLEDSKWLCDNEKCPRYYICHCGKKFGEHKYKLA